VVNQSEIWTVAYTGYNG
jgi:translation initiation factor 2 subunit 3